MEVIADLHLHSKYSRAVSQNMVIPQISLWAAKKGIDLVGTADFTHPLWFRELKTNDKEFKVCRATPLITIIGADMKVYLCCQWRGNLKYVVGDLTNKTFKEVWNSEQHKKLVDSIDVKKCYPCKYKNYNITIEKAFVNDEMHLNFL